MKPLKRIGEEVQFKKIKGNYLYYFSGILISAILLIMIIISFNIPTLFKLLIILSLIFFLFKILKSFQKKSMEDYYIDVRKRCNKSNFQLKGEIIKSISHD